MGQTTIHTYGTNNYSHSHSSLRSIESLHFNFWTGEEVGVSGGKMQTPHRKPLGPGRFEPKTLLWGNSANQCPTVPPLKDNASTMKFNVLDCRILFSIHVNMTMTKGAQFSQTFFIKIVVGVFNTVNTDNFEFPDTLNNVCSSFIITFCFFLLI